MTVRHSMSLIENNHAPLILHSLFVQLCVVLLGILSVLMHTLFAIIHFQLGLSQMSLKQMEKTNILLVTSSTHSCISTVCIPPPKRWLRSTRLVFLMCIWHLCMKRLFLINFICMCQNKQLSGNKLSTIYTKLSQNSEILPHRCNSLSLYMLFSVLC